MTTLLPFQKHFFDCAQKLAETVQMLLGEEYSISYPTPENFVCLSSCLTRTYTIGISSTVPMQGMIRGVDINPHTLAKAVIEDQLDWYAHQVVTAYKQLEGITDEA